MSGQLSLVFALAFTVNLITTLFFSVRIAGARTGRLGSAVALFNVFILLLRISTSFQALLLSKHVERNLGARSPDADEFLFRLLLLSATLGSVLGALLIPTAQRAISRAVAALEVHRSLPRLARRAASASVLRQAAASLRLPSVRNLTQFREFRGLSIGPPALYAVAVSFLTVGMFSPIYAGYFNPQFRVTANNMSLLINGAATAVVLLVTDPFLGVLTDDAIEGKLPEASFRKQIVVFVMAQVVGTVAAQALLVPSARAIAAIAEYL
ncbi:MAG TPA: DUF2837 family protein [Pyrinomonadaceae bacterium]|nr:DUF2837 family protein [Pyrinomonadaceae bacterium]